jgi:hypothetical protein
MATDPRKTKPKTNYLGGKQTSQTSPPASAPAFPPAPASPPVPVLGSPFSNSGGGEGSSDALRDKLAQNLFGVADDMKAKLRVLHKSILEHEWQKYKVKLNCVLEDLKKKDVAHAALMVECEALRQKSRSSSRDEGEIQDSREQIKKLKKEMDDLYEENKALRKIIGTTDHKRARSWK